jgi:hypothetical protein
VGGLSSLLWDYGAPNEVDELTERAIDGKTRQTKPSPAAVLDDLLAQIRDLELQMDANRTVREQLQVQMDATAARTRKRLDELNEVIARLQAV